MRKAAAEQLLCPRPEAREQGGADDGSSGHALAHLMRLSLWGLARRLVLGRIAYFLRRARRAGHQAMTLASFKEAADRAEGALQRAGHGIAADGKFIQQALSGVFRGIAEARHACAHPAQDLVRYGIDHLKGRGA